VSLQN